MVKLLKTLFKVSLLLGIIIIVAIVGIVNFVNPTQFKSIVEKQILEQTGHTLTIEGAITWRWWPMLGLELEQIALKTPTPSQESLFSAQSITAEAALFPLLTGKLFLNLKVHDLDLSFERAKQGKTNWDPLKQRLMASKDPKTPSVESSSQRFYLNSLEIKNGQIRFKDEEKKLYYTLANFNLIADNLFTGLFQKGNPISLSFDLKEDKTKTLGKLQLLTKWSLQQNFNQLNLEDISLKLEPSSGKTTLLKANAEINNLQGNPLIQGNCETENLDVNTWLKNLGLEENPAIPPSTNVKFLFKYQSPQLEISSFNLYAKNNGTLEGKISLNLGTTSAFDFQGNFVGKELKVGSMVLEEIKSNIIGKANVINLNPIVFNIAGVTQQAALQIDLGTATPRFSLTSEGQGFEINQLLAAFNAKNKLAGKTHYKLKLNASGKNAADLRKSLSGYADIEILNGKFYGINLPAVLKNAQASIHGLLDALINKQPFNVKNTLNSEYQRWKVNPVNSQEFTPFDRTKASVSIENGLANNPDFSITHAEYNVYGKGTVNLSTEAIQYQVSLLPKNNPYPANDEVGQYLYATPLPAVITGTLSNPVIRPDLDSYTNQAFAYAQKHFVEKLINKTINKALENILVPKH